MAKNDTVSAEVAKLEEKYKNLKNMKAKAEEYKADIEDYNTAIEEMYDNFDSGASQEYTIKFLEEISETNPNLVIGKINVDEEGELAQAFSIRSIPQLYISKGGKIVKNIGLIRCYAICKIDCTQSHRTQRRSKPKIIF